ncbi:variable surface protein Vir1-like [Plasmodium vivax]|uniref:Variable surface protein Vir1-like n=1 Tax=Plasmodium vivax (strain Salvador I) TaxID=126793 RepID=A5KD83_PLAVS|nr:variable surface protein Vir1-like [Plasmodium vivax]EDL42686.1 variable surface protein Vir1-like [Plasmodium vivax]|eukprot:XP_001612479.1 variable surface protein Vir1-like [Plasmodium vivax Sal-1]
MAESIYTYVDQFPDLASKIFGSGNVTEGTNKKNCEAFNNSKLKTYNGKEKQFINKCTKIVNYIDNVGADVSAKPAYFKYVNYWLYDTLNDVNPFSYNELLDEFYNKIEKFRNCKTYKKYINEEIYNGFKELHKLYDHFNEYKTESIKETKPSCGKGDECADLYELYVRKCKWMHNPDYCSSLEKFKDEYDKYRIPKNKCLDSMKYLTPVGYNPVANFLNFTSFGSWLRPRLPGGKNKTKKLEKKMQELKSTPDVRNSRYTLPYQSS